MTCRTSDRARGYRPQIMPMHIASTGAARIMQNLCLLAASGVEGDGLFERDAIEFPVVRLGKGVHIDIFEFSGYRVFAIHSSPRAMDSGRGWPHGFTYSGQT